MKKNDVLNLKPKDKVSHKRYGECEVKEVMMSMGELFGVVITPQTEKGKIQLAADSGVVYGDLLEDSIRQIQTV